MPWLWLIALCLLASSIALLVLLLKKEQPGAREPLKVEHEWFLPNKVPEAGNRFQRDQTTLLYPAPDHLDDLVSKALTSFELTRYDYAAHHKVDRLVTVVTRCYNKHHLLQRNIDHLQYMIGNQFEQVVLQDKVGGGMQIAETALYAFREKFMGSYICHLDDDDFISNLHLIRDLQPILSSKKAALIIFQVVHESGITYPTVWKSFPIEGQITTSNVLFRRDVYLEPSVSSAVAQTHAGDYAFIHNALIYCQKNNLEVLWVPKPYFFITGKDSPLNDVSITHAAKVLDEQSLATVQLKGRLGNQLFQVATAYAYARRTGKKFVFLPDVDRNAMYDWVRTWKSSVEWKDYTEPDFKYTQLPVMDGNIRLEGYFQSASYFDNYRSELLQLFKRPDHVQLFHRDESARSVSLHIRRGDYLTLTDFHSVLGPKYYAAALAKIPRPAQVFVFSDDLDWCRSEIPNWGIADVTWTFVEEGTDEDQLWMMSLCEYHIIAASSFSWWGAYLSDAPEKTIAPKQWFAESNPIKDWSSIYGQGWAVV